MKKYLFLATAALVFAACSSDGDSFSEKEEPQVPISFDQFITNETRAAIDGADAAAKKKALADAGGFVVYGYKKEKPASGSIDWSTGTQTIFSAENVKSSDNGVNWVYDNLRFWDKQAKYNFYAIAPYNPASGSYTIDGAANGYFTITDAQSKKSTASDDFLVARGGQKNEDGDRSSLTDKKVNFTFHHLMAKVDFKLKSTLSTGTITVTSLKMTGWDAGEGTFVQTLDATPTSLTDSEWTIATAVAGDVTLVGTGSGNASGIELNCAATNPTAVAVTDWYIMVPQTIATNTLTFTINYTYTNGTYTETFTNQVAKVSGQQIWGTDSHTTYTLDIKPGVIEFGVSSICGFDVDGGDKGVSVN